MRTPKDRINCYTKVGTKKELEVIGKMEGLFKMGDIIEKLVEVYKLIDWAKVNEAQEREFNPKELKEVNNVNSNTNN